MTVADRATIANMAPEYGATMGFFPVDDQTLNYLRLTGRDAKQIDLVERYCKEQGLWRQDEVGADIHRNAGTGSGDGDAQRRRPAPAAGSGGASRREAVVSARRWWMSSRKKSAKPPRRGWIAGRPKRR